MNELKINQTPVRTSENYQINDIRVEHIEIHPNEKFENVSYQDFDHNAIELTTKINDFHLTYGMGEELEKEAKQNANITLRFEIKESTKKENMIQFVFDENNRQLMDNIEIVVKENVNAKITIKYAMENANTFKEKYERKKQESIHHGIIRTNIEANAKLNLTVVNLTGFHTHHFLSLENKLEENAKLDYQIVDFGGNRSVTNYYSNLLGDYSENTLNAIYLGIDNQMLDINYIAETRGKNTKMNIDVQGALKDHAKKHFKGTIDFKRGGKKAEGSENEFCMLLSDGAKSISLPMLLCDEEDVVGNHAAAAGKVDHKELFYIMSRGITEAEAKILLVRAKFNKVIDQISNEDLKNELLEEINDRLLSEESEQRGR